MPSFRSDGMIYYFVVATVNLLSAALYLQDNVGLQAVNAAASLMISQIMCSHVGLAFSAHLGLRLHASLNA